MAARPAAPPVSTFINLRRLRLRRLWSKDSQKLGSGLWKHTMHQTKKACLGANLVLLWFSVVESTEHVFGADVA